MLPGMSGVEVLRVLRRDGVATPVIILSAKGDEIDHSVGVVCRAKRGAEVVAGDVLAEVHARTAAEADRGAAEVLAAFDLGDAPPAGRPLLLDVLA